MGDNVLSLNDYLKKDIKSLIKDYSSYLYLQEKSEKTIKGYIQDIKIFYKWWTTENDFDNFKPRLIHKQDIIEYKNYLENNYAHSSVNRKITSLKSFFYMCNYKDYTKHNPVEDIKYIEYDNEAKPKSLSKKDKRKLISIINNDTNKRNKAIVSLFLSTGIRASELVSLNKDNFEVYKEGRGNIEVDGKGHKYRNIPINKGVTKNIRRYLDTRIDDIPALFISERNNRIAYTTVRYAVKNYFSEAGIENASIHTLRHTAAMDLAKKYSINTVKKILGHSDITTTQIYLEARYEDMKEAIDDLDYWE